MHMHTGKQRTRIRELHLESPEDEQVESLPSNTSHWTLPNFFNLTRKKAECLGNTYLHHVYF